MWSQKFAPFLSKVYYISIFLLLITWEKKTSDLLFHIFIFFSFYISTGFFGYVTNDISDEEVDVLAGKTNVTASLSKGKKITIVLLLCVLGIAPIIIYFPKTVLLVLMEYVLLIIYAFPPFRLKEKGMFGVLIDSMYAYFLPSLILLTFLDTQISVDIFFWIFLPSFSLFLGIVNILNHQLEDYDNDIITQTKTFATDNLELAKILRKSSVLVSVIIFEIATVFLWKSDFSLLVKVCFFVIGLVYFIKALFYFIYKKEKYLSEIPELDFIYYNGIVIILFAFISKEFEVFLFTSLLFAPILYKKISNSFHLFWHIGVMNYLRRIFSFIINYSLYYIFLIGGIDLKERAANRKKNQEKETIKINSILLEEKNVHGLWIGTELSPMELLTISSFISKGYIFHLWIYEPLKTKLPDQCICSDANLILSKERIFKYKYSSQFGTGKGSYAGFSDIFRYKLLFEKGGWWVDMDVTCLKSFDVSTPYFFRKHHELPLVGNIMKAPIGSLVMKESYEIAIKSINENNRDWHKPINILFESVKKHRLEHCIYEDVSNPDQWHKIKEFVFSKNEINLNWYFIHWCNEVWRSNGLEKSNPMYESNYGQLLLQYNLITILSEKEVKRYDRKMKFKLIIDNLIEFL